MGRTQGEADIELQHLRCLIVLVEMGSATQAAQRLGMSQPAVSHMLQRLRRTFGDPLLVRVGLRMVPTPRAHELVGQARELLANASQLLAPTPPFDPGTYEGRWSLSMPEYVDCRMTAGLVELLQARAPSSSLIVYPPNPAEADRMLEVGELDLRLGWVDRSNPTMRSRPLYAESFSCLYRRGHPSVRGGLSLERYIAADHVRVQVSRPSTASRAIDAAVQRMGLDLRVALTVPSLLSLGQAVAASNLVATVPSGMARTLAGLHELELAALPLKIPQLTVAMYWHERVQTDRRHRWLRALVAEVAGRLRVE